MSEPKHRLLEQSLGILDFIAEKSRPITFREICEFTGLPKSTVHNLVQTMVSKNYLYKLNNSNSFSIGLRCFETGNAYLFTNPFYSMAISSVSTLAFKCNTTVNLGTLTGDQVVYLYKLENSLPASSCSFIGKQAHAHATAVGKALLAQLSDQELSALYPDGPLKAVTQNTITDFKMLYRQIQEIRKTGISFEKEEAAQFVKCIGTAVVGKNNAALVGISIVLPINYPDNQRNELVKHLLDTKAHMESLAPSYDN